MAEKAGGWEAGREAGWGAGREGGSVAVKEEASEVVGLYSCDKMHIINHNYIL